ncbi:GTP-dependent dephospho-CoA kinase family protein [Vulcanisaeta thermophila]|uniref:GTP-dependent dephospho-CoA kinase family protein n=1 Tax=Vulcanisaeta thermophila TaxID=867917 RepID=UPI000852FEE2|nr:GTP-dependent dephospho-CoA kinase family protein [Vulcanisaeta thermophila]
MYVLTSKWARELMAYPMGIAIGREAPGSIYVLRQCFGDDVKVMTVGDVVTQNVINHWKTPSIAVIDLKTRRNVALGGVAGFSKTYMVTNPPGTLSEEVIEVIRRAMEDVNRGLNVLVSVNGEEDLISLPLILEAPRNSVVLYGLYTGYLIAIPVNDYYRFAILKLISMMKAKK